MTNKRVWIRRIIWSVFTLWLAYQLLVMISIAREGMIPIDFLAYDRAARALSAQRSPYGEVEDSLAIWRSFHATEQELINAPDQNARTALMARFIEQPQQPGPYLYPPSLALFVGFFGVTGSVMVASSIISVGLFGWVWLKITRQHPAWLLLLVGSVEMSNSIHSGNIELLLVALTLGSAWLLWHGHGFGAAPPIAAIVLIKPFYGFFFVAFAALQFLAHRDRARTFKTILAAGGGSLVLISLEVLHWGSRLRGQTFEYLRHAFDYQWFGLPVSEQTPMSIWNRTPLQALISVGVELRTAQWMAAILWVFCLLVTLWCCRARKLGFPLAFALALCLLYIGRPVGWSLIYLDLALLTVCWPLLGRKHRYVLLSIAVGVLLSRWWALTLTAQGKGMQLMTLQHPGFPWETLFLLPGSWLVLLGVIKNSGAVGRFQTEANDEAAGSGKLYAAGR